MKRLIIAVMVAGSLGLLGGCGKGFNCKLDKRTITIITEPAGASVGQINLPGQALTNLGISPIEEQPVVVISAVTKIKNLPYEQAKIL
jgi:cobyric acid synthase